MFSKRKSRMPDEAEALPGREAAMPVPARHAVKDAPSSRRSPTAWRRRCSSRSSND
jgi:hypothetical protein